MELGKSSLVCFDALVAKTFAWQTTFTLSRPTFLLLAL